MATTPSGTLPIITPIDVSATTTHDLWVEARKFRIDIARPTPDTIKLTITRPKNLHVVDGCVVMLSTKPINVVDYPADGTAYDGSLDWTQPADVTMDGAHIVAAYHGILQNPMPTGDPGQPEDVNATTYTFTLTITNTDPTQIYYASVFGSSNVLQYYPLGVQSYPLEGSSLEKAVGNYAGNIPSYPHAPPNPGHGLVYYDQGLNIVQFWDAKQEVWIPTRADTIVSGEYNPGLLGQVYLLSGSQLKIFDGVKWVDAVPQNLRVRAAASTGAGWHNFNSSRAGIEHPQLPEPGDFFYNYSIERYEYFDGETWMFPNASNTLFVRKSGDMVPCFIKPVTVEPEPLRAPDLGELFYNTTAKALNVWDGTIWVKANTDQEGTPLTDKISIGNDGSYDERVRLIKILANQLGWPAQCVELKEEQFNVAVDNAMETFRQLSDHAYRRGFMLYKLIPNQQLYFLNSAIDKTDSIVDIHQIHRMGPLGFFGGGAQDVWSQAFAQQFYNLAAGGGDLLSTFLLQNYSEELTRMFAGNLMFQWNESTRELYFTRAIRGYETVIIECMLERTEQELLSDRWCKQFLQNYALAECKMMLGMIRSKFSSGTPGPSGNITLNGELLIAEARQDMLELREQLLNYEFGGNIGMGNTAFLIG